jgi:hypothetical protein
MKLNGIEVTLEQINATLLAAGYTTIPEKTFIPGCLWKPIKGDVYYVGTSAGMIESYIYTPDTWDDARISTGSCYKTKEAAQKAIDKRIAIHALDVHMRELEMFLAGQYFKADWNNAGSRKYYFYYDHDKESIHTSFTSWRNAHNNWCYSSLEVINTIIKEMPNEIKLALDVE